MGHLNGNEGYVMESHDKVFFFEAKQNHCTQANKFLLFNVYLKIYLHTEKNLLVLFVELSWNVWYSSFLFLVFDLPTIIYIEQFIHTKFICLKDIQLQITIARQMEKMEFLKKGRWELSKIETSSVEKIKSKTPIRYI